MLNQELGKEELVLFSEPGTGIGALLNQGLGKQELVLFTEPGAGQGRIFALC